MTDGVHLSSRARNPGSDAKENFQPLNRSRLLVSWSQVRFLPRALGFTL